MEKVHPWCGQPSDRRQLKNRTEPGSMTNIMCKQSGSKIATHLNTVSRVCYGQACLCIDQVKVSFASDDNGNDYYYPGESFREGLCNHWRTFVCLSVCLFVTTITK